MNEWMQRLSELRQRIHLEDRAKMLALKRQLKPHSPAEATQVVVNGEISREPINKQAAMITSKVRDWLAHPNAVKPMKDKPEMKNLTGNEHPMFLVQHAGQIHNKTDEQFNTELAGELVRRKDKLTDNTVDLALRSLEAYDTLEWSTSNIRKAWVEWMTEANQGLKDIRLLRQAINTETTQLLASLKDLRKFFLEHEYVEEMSRLREFTTLCERLEALQKRGTLDAVADIMLKLAEK